MNHDEPSITLHGTLRSGHTHRVALLLRMLGLPYRFVEAPDKVRRTAEFLQLNPLGQVPVLQEGDLVVCDSNSILVYLTKRYAPGSHWLPEDPAGAAQVQRWLSIAAGEVKYGPGAARIMKQWGGPGDMAAAIEITDKLLRFMEQHLAQRLFLASSHVTIADLACYSYIAHAPEGGITLASYPNIRAWLVRVEALPGFQPMPGPEA